MARHWVLVRGLAREAGHWGPFREALAAAYPDDRVDAVDLPGSGALRHEACPWTVGGMVDRVREVLDAQGPVHLVAISLGGMVAMDWLHRHPAEVRAAVLINTSFAGVSPVHHRFRVHVAAQTLGRGDALARERRMVGVVSNRADLHGEVSARWADVRRARPMAPRNVVRQLVAAARYRAPDPTAVRTRALVLGSEADRLVDVRCSRAIAARYGWPLALHPTGGHALTVDDGPWVLDQVRAFVDALK